MIQDASVVDFDIKNYAFSESDVKKIEDIPYVKNSYPLVYILNNSDKRIAYVGESTNAYKRIQNHLSNPKRDVLEALLLITSEKFNKSATLDIEAKLIKYMSADGSFKLQNGNAGLSGHNYYQMDMYDHIFKEIWSKLKADEFVNKTIPQIENTNLFKYSPYKSLSPDQHQSVLEILTEINKKVKSTLFVSGVAGTGKSVLATYLMKLMHSSDDDLEPRSDETEHIREIDLVKSFKKKYESPKVGLVIPMTSLRQTLSKVFKSVDGLSANMILSPVDVSKEKYDILLVDEAHRLAKRKNIVNYKSFDDANKRLGFPKGTNQLEWLLKQSNHQILFYDSNQSVKPADISKLKFDKLLQGTNAKKIELKSQMRVEGGTDYINFVDRLLNNRLNDDEKFESENYDLKIFESFDELLGEIDEKEDEFGLCRKVAGYSWNWVTKGEPINSDKFDIEIEGHKFKWNTDTKDWVTSENARNEIGCIHTTQGYDLNYTAVIFGDEIKFNPDTNKIIIEKDNYFDRNGKAGIKDPELLKNYIINIYKTLMFRGIKGTYVYVCDSELKKYLKKHIQVY